MGPKGTLRAIQATERRLQREAQTRRRELERQAKEKAKLTAIEQAKLEVETFENQLDLLLSIHKEPCVEWDWIGLAAALLPITPQKTSQHELQAAQLALIAPLETREAAKSAVQQARLQDEQDYQQAMATHASEVIEAEKLRNLAVRILTGDHMAFIEAFAELNPVAEFSSVGSLKQFAVESDTLITCVFKVNANEVIPSEVKTLTASGKVSIKPMPKLRFHEIYQDYVCGCVLRMAREVLAMLPVDVLLVTALADVLNTRSGQDSEQPVLSVAMPRTAVDALNFDAIDPTDAMTTFLHRGNFSASRKAGVFQPITPLVPSDLHRTSIGPKDFADLRARVQTMRKGLTSETLSLKAVAGAY